MHFAIQNVEKVSKGLDQFVGRIVQKNSEMMVLFASNQSHMGEALVELDIKMDMRNGVYFITLSVSQISIMWHAVSAHQTVLKT